MTVFIFGNSDVEIDSLPLRILPELKKILPNAEFKVLDPNEEWDLPDELIVIDTVIGIDKVTSFDDLGQFAKSPRITMHGFDALMNLQLLKKLGKISQIKIIGIPPTISEQKAVEQVVFELKEFVSQS